MEPEHPTQRSHPMTEESSRYFPALPPFLYGMMKVTTLFKALGERPSHLSPRSELPSFPRRRGEWEVLPLSSKKGHKLEQCITFKMNFDETQGRRDTVPGGWSS